MPDEFDLRDKRVWIAGHRGMVGAALVRRLEREGCTILVTDRQAVDLRRQAETEHWIAAQKPDLVFVAAARVGGILANANYPADFLYDNLIIEANVIKGSYAAGVKKLVFLGSSCIYPKMSAQPIVEDALLTGPLEPTNQWYAIAKIAGIKLCEAFRVQFGADFISAMPTNLYGPGDNFDLDSSHVLPALMRKAHEAKRAQRSALTLWGSGTPRREFLHVDDCADALVHLAKHYSGHEHVNVGFGDDVTIFDLAQLVSDIVGFRGTIECDPSKPDGTPRKLMNSDKLRGLGWTPQIPLESGVSSVYQWFVEHHAA